MAGWRALARRVRARGGAHRLVRGVQCRAGRGPRAGRGRVADFDGARRRAGRCRSDSSRVVRTPAPVVDRVAAPRRRWSSLRRGWLSRRSQADGHRTSGRRQPCAGCASSGACTCAFDFTAARGGFASGRREVAGGAKKERSCAAGDARLRVTDQNAAEERGTDGHEHAYVDVPHPLGRIDAIEVT